MDTVGPSALVRRCLPMLAICNIIAIHSKSSGLIRVSFFWTRGEMGVAQETFWTRGEMGVAQETFWTRGEMGVAQETFWTRGEMGVAQETFWEYLP